MSEEIHKVQIVLPPTPSAKAQLKDATVATVIGLAPLALFIGVLAGWAKWAEKREAKKNPPEEPAVDETVAE